ncbi:hypothetical protein F4779DRAFT_210792 [Xylariaceae sp. FL0662B]|nr:hypothetical protein F4779DRAFT_210792 [Xylariaceae sp. FL0662B]
MSHSKRNTSRAVFTSHERDLARKAWSSTTARLSRESFLAFSACRLCLEVARDPVSCAHGDVFCRECALSNILAQKKEIRRLDRQREQEARDAAERRKRDDAEARERAVREFEMTQNGLLPARAESRNGGANHKDNNGGAVTAAAATPIDRRRSESAVTIEETANNSSESRSSIKRKFEMDEEELARIAAEDRTKARKAIEDEKAAKPTLPSFWAPSITPSSNTKDALHEVAKKTKSSPVCPASPEERPHAYSLHTLVTVNFTEEEEEENGGQSKRRRIRVCPSCKKGLTNASKAMLAKPCGHVICQNCVDKFMRPSKHHDPHAPAVDADDLRCYVCETNLSEKNSSNNDKGKKDKEKIRPGLVELRSEGTGFSAGGTSQVQKAGVAFQC